MSLILPVQAYELKLAPHPAPFPVLKFTGIRIAATGIEDGTWGNRTVRSSAFSRQGRASLAEAMNTWTHAKFDDNYVARNPSTGELLVDEQAEIKRDDNSVLKVSTDELGKTSLFTESVHIRLVN